MKILNKDWIINLEKTILWQYDKAEKLQTLANKKQIWYKQKVTDFVVSFFYNIFNIRTATDFGLNIWGKILNFPRQVVNKNNGTIINLTTEQYRFLLLGQVLKFKMSCTVPEINKYLALVFNDNEGRCYVKDNQNMTIQYIIGISVPTEIQALIDNVDFLPRPAGVRLVFGNDVYYQVSLNVYDNKGNLVTETSAITMSWEGQSTTNSVVTVISGTELTISVSKNGYISQSQTLTVDNDINLNINLIPESRSFVINATPDIATITLIVNDTDTYSDTGTLTESLSYGDTYSYEVSLLGYASQSGSGILTENTELSIVLAKIEKKYTISVSQSRPTAALEVLQDLGTYSITKTGIYSIELAGSKGYYIQAGHLGYLATGGIAEIQLPLSIGQKVKAVAIPGGYYSTTSSATNKGGFGMAVYIDEELVAVAGGGGSHSYTAVSEVLSYVRCGGGGYLGGQGTPTNKQEVSGLNISGNKNTVNTSSARTGMADGGAAYSTGFGYGGTGYLSTNYESYVVQRESGSSDTAATVTGNNSYVAYVNIVYIQDI